METPAAGQVVTVTYPYSDLSRSKMRPAVVLAAMKKEDCLLCQITSNPFSDPRSIELGDADFAVGSLQRVSYARPGKLFTGHASLIGAAVGTLSPEAMERVRDAVIRLIRGK